VIQWFTAGCCASEVVNPTPAPPLGGGVRHKNYPRLGLLLAVEGVLGLLGAVLDVFADAFGSLAGGQGQPCADDGNDGHGADDLACVLHVETPGRYLDAPTTPAGHTPGGAEVYQTSRRPFYPCP